MIHYIKNFRHFSEKWIIQLIYFRLINKMILEIKKLPLSEWPDIYLKLNNDEWPFDFKKPKWYNFSWDKGFRRDRRMYPVGIKVMYFINNFYSHWDIMVIKNKAKLIDGGYELSREGFNQWIAEGIYYGRVEQALISGMIF